MTESVHLSPLIPLPLLSPKSGSEGGGNLILGMGGYPPMPKIR